MLHVHLPRDEQEFYLWATLLIILYVVLASAVRLARAKRNFEVSGFVFEAATFSGSILLLIGVTIDPQVLKLMGDTTWFLIIAGVAGVANAVVAPFR